MKKLFLIGTLAILLPISASSADEVVTWDTIAPPEYVDAQWTEDNTFINKHPIASAFSAMSIVGMPRVLSSIKESNSINANNYWYERRKNFEIQRDMCKQLKDADKRTECFINLRQSELQKTADKRMEQIQRQQLNAIRSVGSSIDDLNRTNKNINNNLYNINNSINRPRSYTIYKY